MHTNKLYHSIRPRKGEVTALILSFPLVMLGLAAFGIFLCVSAPKAYDGGEHLLFFAVLTFLMLALAAVFFPCAIVYRKKLNRKKAERLARLDAAQLFVLEQQVQHSTLYYGTFYLLADHLYAPRAGMLLAYEEIFSCRIRIQRSKGIKVGVTVSFDEADGFRQSVSIKKWRQFLDRREEFLDLLNAKGQNVELL